MNSFFYQILIKASDMIYSDEFRKIKSGDTKAIESLPLMVRNCGLRKTNQPKNISDREQIQLKTKQVPEFQFFMM